MQLTILGASGRTGQLLVAQALDAGHGVTAVVRHPDGLCQRHPHLAVVASPRLVTSDLHRAFAGADAILSALGTSTPRQPTTVYSQAAAACVEWMNGTGVTRIVTISAIPAGPDAHKTRTERAVVHPLLHTFFGGGYDDMRRMEHLLAASERAWTVIRPPRLTDRPPKHGYRAAVDARLSRAFSMPRGDLATAMLDALGQATWIGHAVNVAT